MEVYLFRVKLIVDNEFYFQCPRVFYQSLKTKEVFPSHDDRKKINDLSLLWIVRVMAAHP